MWMLMKTDNYHFYGCNSYEWKTSKNIHDVINWFVGQKHPYQLWYVPVADDVDYKIENYQPVVEGAVYLNSYKHEELFNH